MKLLKIDISESQKNIIIMGAAVLFFFLLFWLFLYFPSSKEITGLKRELALTQQQIQGIEILLAGSRGRDEAIHLLKERQQYLNSRFPQKEEASLRIISEVARKMNIDVVSLQPGLRAEFLDESGKQVLIDGKAVCYLPITIEVVCFYKDLVSYLTELKNSLPAFVSVASLNVNKDNRFPGKVRANAGFNLYLLI
ncbi:MAG: hypothetical protein PHC71_02360 [Candidatus Omnitrophica bacterium]|nr:hypothetical protein [Candidatus Omnitrophota bacterium]